MSMSTVFPKEMLLVPPKGYIKGWEKKPPMPNKKSVEGTPEQPPNPNSPRNTSPIIKGALFGNSTANNSSKQGNSSPPRNSPTPRTPTPRTPRRNTTPLAPRKENPTKRRFAHRKTLRSTRRRR